MSSIITEVKCYGNPVPEKSSLRGLGAALIQTGESPFASLVLKLLLYHKLAHINQYATRIQEMP